MSHKGSPQMWEWDHKEGWVPKNWCFELWCWKRLLRVPWSAGRSNQSILKKINPKYSLEGLLLKLQYFGRLMWRTNSLEKILVLEKTEGKRRRGLQRMRQLDSITASVNMNLSNLWEIVEDREDWRTIVSGVAHAQGWVWLNDCIVTTSALILKIENQLGKGILRRGHSTHRGKQEGKSVITLGNCVLWRTAWWILVA